MSKEEDWKDLWAHTETAFGGKVSLLVNNAGVNPTHGWKLCVNIMLTGVGYGTFLALEKMGTSKVCLILLTNQGWWKRGGWGLRWDWVVISPSDLCLLNPVWYGIGKQEKCSSLDQPRGNFYRT